jgi:hypothetical protein
MIIAKCELVVSESINTGIRSHWKEILSHHLIIPEWVYQIVENVIQLSPY